MNRDAGPLLDEAVARGVAFVNGAPYGGGMLVKGPDAQPSLRLPGHRRVRQGSGPVDAAGVRRPRRAPGRRRAAVLAARPPGDLDHRRRLGTRADQDHPRSRHHPDPPSCGTSSTGTHRRPWGGWARCRRRPYKRFQRQTEKKTVAMSTDTPAEVWRDADVPDEDRVEALMARMSLARRSRSSTASGWASTTGDGEIAPHQHEFAPLPVAWDELVRRRHRPADPAVRHRARRRPDQGAQALASAQRTIIARGPVGHPRAGARGVPDRPRRLEGHRLPVAVVLGRQLRPGPGRADGRADRRHHAAARDPPGPGPGPRRRPRPALGPGRGDHRRGPRPRRHDRQRVRPRSAVRGCGRHPQALRRATPPPRRAATWPPCRWAAARSPTCCCRRSRWRCGPGPAR